MRAKHVDAVAWDERGCKERKTLNVIPMGVGNQQVDVEWLASRRSLKCHAKRPNSRACIKDHLLTREVNRHTRCIAAIPQGSRTWRRNRAPLVPSFRLLLEIVTARVGYDLGDVRYVMTTGWIEGCPAHVRLTSACLAEIRGVTKEEIASVTTANARRLFQVSAG